MWDCKEGYEIRRVPGKDNIYICFGPDGPWTEICKGLDDAKAACQANFKSKIKS